ncbi:MAG: DEAD/DEAH box helicase family protein [Gemmatimonadaceae bacterium]
MTLGAAAAVRARLALAWFGEQSAATAGRFTLRPAQCEAIAAIETAFERSGGALLADPPGTGKTVIALAIARRFDDALVLAPAVLRTQWERSAARAGARVRFTSFEALSRTADPTRAPLLIVDEAHHLRTPGTLRYQQAARLASGARVLLLTATPVVNRRADRDALLALFLGGRAAALDAATLAQLIIRRQAERSHLPVVRRLASLASAADVRGIGSAIARLPPPFPAADGAAARALIRISLAMAWCSSLAALDASLRRRLQRGAALADALGAGRWPDRASLRQWIVADDATQLAFPALAAPTDRAPPAEALTLLRAHLVAVRDLRAVVAPAVATDTATRAASLRRILDSRHRERVVVFAHHAETIRALWRALRHVGGVVALTGARVFAAGGRWRRAEVLDALGAHGKPWSADDPRAIRLVLATDLLAEGVELQGARILVHGDGAWTPARLEQRLGRLARVGAGARCWSRSSARPPAPAPSCDSRRVSARRRRSVPPRYR